MNDYTARDIIGEGYKPALTKEDVMEHYERIVIDNVYDEASNGTRYKGPLYVKQALDEYMGNLLGKNIKIFDIAAGTGLLGNMLKQSGYTNLHALEPCKGMVDVAKERRIYGSYIYDFIGEDPIPGVENDSFDALVMSGGMGQGHVPKEACREMARVVRPGGYIINAMREAYLYDVAEYRDKLEPYMKQLEDEGRWKLVERRCLPNYFMKFSGIVFIHQVL